MKCFVLLCPLQLIHSFLNPLSPSLPSSSFFSEYYQVLHTEHLQSKIRQQIEILLMFIIYRTINTVRIFLTFRRRRNVSLLISSIVDSGGFVNMHKLAPDSILTKSVMFEVDTNFGFVVLIEEMFISKFMLVMCEGALPK